MAPQPGAPGEGLLVRAAVAPEPKIERRNEWVQVAGYTTVVRSRPSSAAPPLLAYSVGRPFRGVAREAGFVRVQDLGSGQLGWVEESSLVPFVGGYRQREQQVVEPQVAVAEPQATVAKPLVAVAKPKTYRVPAKKVEKPPISVLAARAKKEA